MAKLQDVRKTVESSIGAMSPARAQELAKTMLDRDAAKERVSKLAADLMDWSQRNGNRISAMIRKEVRDQLQQAGAATEEDLNALKKRVRELERRVKAQGASPRAKRTTGAAAKGSAKKPTAKPHSSG
jgi:polyhydroxyalkanoate synthesis regulator phasin